MEASPLKGDEEEGQAGVRRDRVGNVRMGLKGNYWSGLHRRDRGRVQVGEDYASDRTDWPMIETRRTMHDTWGVRHALSLSGIARGTVRRSSPL